MPASMLLTWWNLVFIVPFGLALLYLVLYTISGVTFGDDFDADASADADGDAHFETDASGEFHAEGHDVGGDVHVEHDHDHDHSHEAHASHTGHTPFVEAMTWLGLGKAPLSILLMVMLLAWGMTGFITNVALWDAAGRAVPLVSLPLAAVMSVALTHMVGRAFARFLPRDEGKAPSRSSLVGNEGEAVFNIDQRFGMVAVRDGHGELYQYPCRVYEDRDPIRKGDKVLLVDYDRDQKMFYVTRSEIGARN